MSSARMHIYVDYPCCNLYGNPLYAIADLMFGRQEFCA